MNTDDIQPDNENKLPTTASGNASNPPANGDTGEQDSQLLGEKAEKYLREGGNIEDMPDEEDWKDADDKLDKENI